jgi:hypothetical protein
MAATKPPVTVTIPQIHYFRSTARHLAICSHLFITLPLREPASLNATPAPPEYCAKSAALPVAAMATVPRARFVGRTRGMMTVVVNADTAEMLGAAQLRCDSHLPPDY